MAHFTGHRQSQIELQQRFGRVAQFVVQQREVAPRVAFPVPVVHLACELERPLVVRTRLVTLADEMRKRSEVAAQAALPSGVAGRLRDLQPLRVVAARLIDSAGGPRQCAQRVARPAAQGAIVDLVGQCLGSGQVGLCRLDGAEREQKFPEGTQDPGFRSGV